MNFFFFWERAHENQSSLSLKIRRASPELHRNRSLANQRKYRIFPESHSSWASDRRPRPPRISSDELPLRRDRNRRELSSFLPEGNLRNFIFVQIIRSSGQAIFNLMENWGKLWVKLKLLLRGPRNRPYSCLCRMKIVPSRSLPSPALPRRRCLCTSHLKFLQSLVLIILMIKLQISQILANFSRYFEIINKTTEIC